MELPDQQYAFDIRSPFNFLSANLDGLRWYIDDMINFDAGTVSRYKERFVSSNEIHSYFSKESKLDFACKLGQNTIVYEQAEIGEGTRLANSVVCKGAKVFGLCQLNKALIGFDAKVGQSSSLKNVSVGSKASIGSRCKLSNVIVD